MLQVQRACRIALYPYSTGTPGLQNRFIPLLYMYILREKRQIVPVDFTKHLILIASCTCRFYETLDPDSFVYL